MLLGGYSLEGKPATITHEFPEIRHSPGDPSTSRVNWADATPVSLPVDHFTCHADGRFHAKARCGPLLYEHIEHAPAPLGPDSPVFLDVLIISDVVSKYAVITSPPKYPHVWFQVPQSGTVSLNAIFSGARFPLVGEALASISASGRTEGTVGLRAGTLQGIVWGSPRPVPPEAAKGRPPGTIFMFHWRRGARIVGLKGFVLN
jgi:hypothetical protein